MHHPRSLLLCVPLLFACGLTAQDSKSSDKTPPAAPPIVIPAEAARAPNPVKPTPESLAQGKRWWNLDCAMCHGKLGDAQGDTPDELKSKLPDLTNPAALKNRSDGELFYFIQTGNQDMPGEGTRLKPDQAWSLVNYVRSLARNKTVAEKSTQ